MNIGKYIYAFLKKQDQIIVILTGIFTIFMWLQPPPAGLSVGGWRTLIVIVLAAIFWITNVIAPAYTSLIIIFLLLISGTSTPGSAFTFWSDSLAWLIIGAFLLVGAIKKSGVGEKLLSRVFGEGFISFSKLVCLIYLAQILLVLIIPHPFPRNLLLMGSLHETIRGSNLTVSDKAKIGFIVFSSALPVSTLILTGDSVLNASTIALSGSNLNWLGWFKYMGLPAAVITLITLLIHLKFYRITTDLQVKSKNLKIKSDGKIVLFWLVLAAIGWITDSIHGVGPAWIALGAAIGLALPIPRPVLNVEEINKSIQWPLLIFLTGALAIGVLSQETGLAGWLVDTLVPVHTITNDYTLGLFVGGISIVLHMVVSNVFAAICVATPPLVEFTARSGWNPLAAAMIVNVAANMVYFFPFQNTAILLGSNETGFITHKETLKYGTIMTGVVVIVILIQVLWWKTIRII